LQRSSIRQNSVQPKHECGTGVSRSHVRGYVESNIPAGTAKRHGVPIEIALIVADVESHSNCFARGLAGELGPLQIKPATARLLGYTGPEFALQSCGEGLEWGMKHLALALQHGGVWKHNQGLWAKQRSAYGTKYERTVLASYISRKLSPRKLPPAPANQVVASKM
jgi:hypothetical protein